MAAPVIVSQRGIGRAAVAQEPITCGAWKTQVAPTFVAANHALPGAQPVAALVSLFASARDGDDTEGSPVRAYRLAEGLLAVNDPLGALHILEPALEKHGDESSLQLLAARSYFGSCQLGRARQVLEHLVDRDPTDDYARFLLGRTMERVNDNSEALRHFRVAMALSPSPEYSQAMARVTTRISA